MTSGEFVESSTQTDVSLQPSALVSFVSAGGPRVSSSTTTEGTTIRSELRGGVFGGVARKTVGKREDDPKSPFVPIGDPFTPPRRVTKEAFTTVSTLRSLSPLDTVERDRQGPKLPDFGEKLPEESRHPPPPPPPPQQSQYFSGNLPTAATSHWAHVHTVAPSWGSAGTNWSSTYSPLMVSWVPMPVSPALTNLTNLYRRRVQNRLGAANYSTTSTSYGNVFF